MTFAPPFIKFAGPVIDFGPSITFRKTVTIKLPLVPGTVAPPEGFSLATCVGMFVRAYTRVQVVKESRAARAPVRVLSFTHTCAHNMNACAHKPTSGSEYTAYLYNKDQNIWQKRKHYSQNPKYV